MFGADAPKLMKLIADELKKCSLDSDGCEARQEYNITDLSDEEQKRHQSQEQLMLECIKLEDEAREKEKRELITKTCEKILDVYGSYIVLIAFPMTKDQISSTPLDQWESMHLKFQKQEKISLKESDIEEILYFSNLKFTENDKSELIKNQCLALLFEVNEDITNLDDFMYNILNTRPKLQTAYKQKYIIKLIEMVDLDSLKSNNLNEENFLKDDLSDSEEKLEVCPVWMPRDQYTRALAIKKLFPKLMESCTFDLRESIPHVAVAYDAFKKQEIMNTIQKHSNDVMRIGFFSSDSPNQAKLLAKTMNSFDSKINEVT